jgi:hypothetical protein
MHGTTSTTTDVSTQQLIALGGAHRAFVGFRAVAETDSERMARPSRHARCAGGPECSRVHAETHGLPAPRAESPFGPVMAGLVTGASPAVAGGAA